jgi:excisionase family DNA binding protein
MKSSDISSSDEEGLSLVNVEMNKDQEFLTSQDVATILGCAPDEVITLARTGKIRASKQGKHWKFLRGNVADYMKRKAEED